MTTPTLLFAGAHDTQMSIERVRAMYDVLGSEKKIFVDLACSSHNALWEENRLLMFDASVEWLRTGTVNSEESGALRLGY